MGVFLSSACKSDGFIPQTGEADITQSQELSGRMLRRAIGRAFTEP